MKEQMFLKIINANGLSKYMGFEQDTHGAITAAAGQEFQLTAFINGEEIIIEHAFVVVQSGDDLIVKIEGSGAITLIDYATAEDVSLTIVDEAGDAQELLSVDQHITLDDGDTLVYAQGEVEQLMDLVEASYEEIQEVLASNATSNATSSSDSESSNEEMMASEGLEATSGSFVALMGAAVGGAAVALSGSSSSSGGVASGLTISGQFTAGPAIDSHDLRVKIFDADGNEIGESELNADGTYSITLDGSYTGAIVVQVYSSGPALDYRDEGTNTGVNLNTNIRAVVYVSGDQDQVINPTAVTEVATRKLLDDDGVVGDVSPTGSRSLSARGLETSAINSNNQNVATALGLDIDIITQTPVSTNEEGFDSGSESAQAYGRALAALSALEQTQETSTSNALQRIVDGIVGDELDTDQIQELQAAAAYVDTVAGNADGNSEHYQQVYDIQVSAIRLSEDTGTPSDSITSVVEQTIIATLGQALSDGAKLYGRIDNDAWVDISGSITETGTNVSWTGVRLNEGVGRIQMVVTSDGEVPAADESNIVGDISSESYVLDTEDPAVPNAALTNNSGSDDDSITNDASITAPSNVETGATVEYRVKFDGGEFSAWSSTYQAPASDGSADGEYVVEVGQTDVAGNRATQVLSFTLDSQAAAPSLVLATDSGTSDSDGITNVATVNIEGLESGATWQYRVDGGAWQAGTGTSFELTEGAHSYQVRQTDAAGNQSEASTAVSYTLDTTGPQLVTSINVNENSTTVGSVLASAETQQVTYSISGGADQSLFTIDSNGDLSFVNGEDYENPDDANRDNGYEVQVTATDTAGNEAAETITVNVQNVNEAPVVDGSISDQHSIVNQAITAINVSTVFSDPESDTLTYSASNLPAGLSINSETGVISGTPETISEQEVTVTATDPDSEQITYSFIFNITPAIAITALTISDDNIINASDPSQVTVTGRTIGIDDDETITITVGDIQVEATVTNNQFSTTFDRTSVSDSASVEIRAALNGDASVTRSTSIVVDTALPATPNAELTEDSGSSASDRITNDGSITAPSNTETGATVEYRMRLLDSEFSAWSSTYQAPATDGSADGAYTVEVRQIDANGNVSATPQTIQFTLDTTEPSTPSMRLASDTGPNGNDGVTSIQTVLVSGLEPGASWEYKIDDGAWITGSEGTFTLTEGMHNYQVRQTDVAGNQSDASTAIEYTLDSTKPDAPVMALANDTGSSNSDGITARAEVNVTGLESGAGWEYRVDSGEWQTGTGTGFNSTVGTHNYQVRQIDVAGLYSDPSVPIEYTLDIDAPDAPTMALADDTGSSTSDRITKEAAVSVSGLENGATWQYRVNGGNWQTGAGSSFDLTEGTNSYQVRQADAVWSSMPSTAIEYTLDTSQPQLVTSINVNENVLEIGSVLANEETQQVTYTISGGADQSLFTIDADGNLTFEDTQTYDFEQPGDANRDNGYEVQITATDVAGNTAVETITVNLRDVNEAPESIYGAIADQELLVNEAITSIDASAAFTDPEGDTLTYTVSNLPAGLSINSETGVISGTPEMISEQEVTVTATDPEGEQDTYSFSMNITPAQAITALTISDDNIINASDPNMVTVTGRTIGIADGGIIDIIIDNISFASITIENNQFSATLDRSRLGDDNSLAVNASLRTDRSVTRSTSIVVDTTLPATPNAELTQDSGSSASDRITNDGSITAPSNTETGATVEYRMRLLDSEFSAWSSTYQAPATDGSADGAYTVEVRQTDANANVSATPQIIQFTLDTSAIAPSLSLLDDTGSSDSDSITKEATVNVLGLENGATWQYRVNGSNWQTGTGTTFELTEGSNDYSVRQLDVAGNQSNPSILYSFTLDTQAPAAAPTLELVADTGSSNSDNLTKEAMVNVLGLENEATWEYRVAAGAWQTGTGTTFELTEGSFGYRIRQIDLAGNIKQDDMRAYNYVLDTSASAPSLSLDTDSGSSSSDGITKEAVVNVSGLENGATWEYRVNGGEWQTGSDTSFELTEGSRRYQVRQLDAAGNQSDPSAEYSYTLDTQNPNYTGPITLRINENSTVVTLETSEAVTLAITGGPDEAKFTINENGALVFREAPDFEAPTDWGRDNYYTVYLTMTDTAGNTLPQTSYPIRVEDVAEPSVLNQNIITQGNQIRSAVGAETLTGTIGEVDIFDFNTIADGDDTLVNFTLADQDRLDLSDVLSYASSDNLSNFLSVTDDGADVSMAIDANGDGSGTDLTLTLSGLGDGSVTLSDLEAHLIVI